MLDSCRMRSELPLTIVCPLPTCPLTFSPEQIMDEDQISWIHRKRESIVRLLCSRHTDEQTGDSFLLTVERILEREVLWNRWKNEGCPSFVRFAEKLPTTPRKRRMNPLVDRSGNKIYRFGNRTLDELWNACPDNLAACRDERRLFRPDLSTYFQDAILQLDPEEKVEEQYKYINKEEWCWRALRCLSRRCPYFYINWHPPGRPVKDYLTVILTEKLQSEDDRKANHDSGSVSSSANRREVSNPMAEPSPAKQPRLDQDVVTDGTSSTHSSRARQTVADRDASSRRGVTSVRRDSIHPTGSANQPTDIYEQDDSVLDEVSRMSSLINCDCC
ncbi:hypothetical protein FBUS_10623 [Fasciolopsis buskii]|uniref:Uncharacterized protein n=1 Tax=Fasciolopsis buskii TaxID=27845 RepID=A0A8E0VP05_9TREM|nr:hypothetical protein FBUS_10623 [Fasciolopsis buski]